MQCSSELRVTWATTLGTVLGRSPTDSTVSSFASPFGAAAVRDWDGCIDGSIHGQGQSDKQFPRRRNIGSTDQVPVHAPLVHELVEALTESVPNVEVAVLEDGPAPIRTDLRRESPDDAVARTAGSGWRAGRQDQPPAWRRPRAPCLRASGRQSGSAFQTRPRQRR